MTGAEQQLVNLFHIGAQKTGTTWVYQALREHPEVSTSPTDSTHYFDFHFHKGVDWYHSLYADRTRPVLMDSTPSYIRNRETARRIAEYNPSARILLTARNPIERAFSHYWHEKKKDRFNYSFSELFHNYDLFTDWLEPGLYSRHIRNYLEFFPGGSLRVMFTEDLASDSVGFYADLLEFIGLERKGEPKVLRRKVNEASDFRSRKAVHVENKLVGGARALLGPRFARGVGKLAKSISGKGGHRETLDDVDAQLLQELKDFFRADIQELETLTGRNLEHWLR